MDQRRECRARTRSALIIYSLRQLRLSLWFTVASVRLDVYPAPLNAEVLFVCPLSFALWASILKYIALPFFSPSISTSYCLYVRRNDLKKLLFSFPVIYMSENENYKKLLAQILALAVYSHINEGVTV